MGKNNCVPNVAGRVGTVYIPRSIAESFLVARKRESQPRFRASPDEHHLLARGKTINQTKELLLRGIETASRAASGFHARAQIKDDNSVARRRAGLKQGGVGKRHDEKHRGDQLQEEKQVVPQQPSQTGAERPLLQHALPQKQRGGPDFSAFGLEAVKK
jgi:hypothetical protein